MALVQVQGESKAAAIVRENIDRAHRSLQESAALGIENVLRHDLAEVWEECRRPDWDGYHALPVTREVYAYAERFLRSLPLGVQTPSIGAEPDGCITVEWRPSRRRTLSVSVSPDGDLSYAALLGPEKTYGSVPLIDEPPRAILQLIGRVYSC